MQDPYSALAVLFLGETPSTYVQWLAGQAIEAHAQITRAQTDARAEADRLLSVFAEAWARYEEIPVRGDEASRVERKVLRQKLTNALARLQAMVGDVDGVVPLPKPVSSSDTEPDCRDPRHDFEWAAATVLREPRAGLVLAELTGQAIAAYAAIDQVLSLTKGRDDDGWYKPWEWCRSAFMYYQATFQLAVEEFLEALETAPDGDAPEGDGPERQAAAVRAAEEAVGDSVAGLRRVIVELGRAFGQRGAVRWADRFPPLVTGNPNDWDWSLAPVLPLPEG